MMGPMRRRHGGRGGPVGPAVAPEAPVPTARAAGPKAGPIEARATVPVPPAEALSWFRDADRWVRFQGKQAALEARPGGRIRIDLGDEVIVLGHFVELSADRIVLTWGMAGDQFLPADSSRITITALELPGGASDVTLVHEGLPNRQSASEHGSGWRYHLVRLAVAASGVTGDDERVDLLFAAFAESDVGARIGLLTRTCAERVELADRVGVVTGISAVSDHVGRGLAVAEHRHTNRTNDVQRVGSIVHCGYRVVDTNAGVETEVASGDLVAALGRDERFSTISLFG